MKNKSPSKNIESVVAYLIPLARREEVLGDLHERYRGTAQYLLDALRTVPHVVASQMRRATDWRLLIFEAFTLYVAFLTAPAQPGGVSLLFKAGTLLPCAIPTIVALIALRIVDAYSRAGRPTRITQLAQVALAVAIAFGVEELVRLEDASMALPRAVLLSGGILGLFLVWLVRSAMRGSGTAARPATPSSDGGHAMSQEDIQRGIENLRATVRKRNLVGGGACLVVALSFALYLFLFKTALMRIGAALTVASALYMAMQILLIRKGAKTGDWKVSDSLAVYRAELERQRDFHRGAWFWSRLVAIVPGYLIFFAGMAIAFPKTARPTAGIVAFFIFIGFMAVRMNLSQARNYQKEIDRLDAGSNFGRRKAP